MEAKDYISIGLSVLALALSVFIVWWGTFRKRIALYFVQSRGWSYILVNGGKTDILITDAKYWFSGTSENEWSGPPQKTDVELPVLLEAGKALQHHVSFPDGAALFEGLVRQGREVPDQPRFRAQTVRFGLGWVDVDGMERTDEVVVGEVWVGEKAFYAWLPKVRRADFSRPRLGGVLASKTLGQRLRFWGR
ncbi:MAG: hypothetical protein IBJ14_07450 [Hydrogenophaga sp.]|nr:hypothetical protein [Hydrogenophaga sp.]